MAKHLMMHTKGSNSPTMANPRVTGRPILFLAVILVAGCLLLYLYQRNIVARGKARFAEQALGRTVAKLTGETRTRIENFAHGF